MRMLWCIAALACGCSRSVSPPLCDPGSETVALTATAAAPVLRADVIFVVADGPTMMEEQASLAAQLPRLVTVLATGDRNGDGEADFVPYPDLHVGAITADLGVAGADGVDGCPALPLHGDDGVLVATPRVGGAACALSYPSFLSFLSEGGSPMQLATDATCLARTGTRGCTVAQPLAATLRALLPTRYVFADGGHGHGDEPSTNAGFLRADSMLVVIVLADQDDCSAEDPELWRPASTTHSGPIELRCTAYATELTPVSTFVDALHALRPGGENLVFGAVGGVPEDLVTLTGPDDRIDYAAVLADPRMALHLTTSAGITTLDPACFATGRGIATPALRLAEAARALGASGVMQSICSADYGPILYPAERPFGTVRIAAACLPESPVGHDDGTFDCEVEARIDPPRSPLDPRTCTDLVTVSATPIATDPDGTIHCRVPQVLVDAATRDAGTAPTGSGWYYDDYSIETGASCGGTLRRVALTGVLPASVAVSASCVLPPRDARCAAP